MISRDVLKHLPLGMALFLGACASTVGTDADFKGDETQDVRAAVAGPVNDVGLMLIEIPEYLAEMDDPYADAPATCPLLETEVERLDALLGDDLNIPEDEREQREQTALNATSDTVGSVLIPFRGAVRFISGAAANERDAREAYQRGLVRRAYLKGLAEERSCDLTSP
ncbi:MAG: hypothetical protein AAFP97_08365 [Pseudomonadota bacterium]